MRYLINGIIRHDGDALDVQYLINMSRLLSSDSVS